MANRAILIVEDEPGIGEILEYALNDEPGYQATAVPNGAAALAFLAEVRVDLMLLDINMPGLDGFAIHDLIRARPGTAGTPILFMTAADHTEEFVRRGVGTWLAKPFAIDDLLALVASVLDRGPAGDGVAPHGGQEGRDQGQ
jgi:DNA-binding response OmpR family regulator